MATEESLEVNNVIMEIKPDVQVIVWSTSVIHAQEEPGNYLSATQYVEMVMSTEMKSATMEIILDALRIVNKM